MKHEAYNMKQGFSLAGVIIATFVVTAGMTAIFNLAHQAIRSSNASETRLVASGLVQEAVEIIRNTRNSYADWRSWEWYSTTTPMVHPIGDFRVYCLQYDTVDLSSASCPPSEVPLKLDTSLGSYGVYQYTSGNPTEFYRKTILTRLSNDELKVEVEVKWYIPNDTSRHFLNVEDRLWNWK